MKDHMLILIDFYETILILNLLHLFKDHVQKEHYDFLLFNYVKLVLHIKLDRISKV